jgi:hypothetical protein
MSNGRRHSSKWPRSHTALLFPNALSSSLRQELVSIFPLTEERKFFWHSAETVSCSSFVTTRTKVGDLAPPGTPFRRQHRVPAGQDSKPPGNIHSMNSSERARREPSGTFPITLPMHGQALGAQGERLIRVKVLPVGRDPVCSDVALCGG